MTTTYRAAPDIDVVTSNVTIPVLGTIPVNSFVLHGSQPVLVDTGPVVTRDEFMNTLASVIDPADLRWIWLTHTDFDHIGALPLLLAENPELRVITSFVGMGIMGLFDPLPMDRVYLINPGQSISVGDRTLTAFKPPVFDNPVTTGFRDDRSGALFTSDCFGAVLSAVPENAEDLSDDELRQGQVLWTSVDSPWIHKVDRARLAGELDAIRAMEATTVLSSHLPAAPGTMIDRLIASITATPDAQVFAGPDQAAFDQMLAAMASGEPPS